MQSDTGNGVRESLGELRGQMLALIRDMQALQDNQRELQQAFADVASEFAQHIAVHVDRDHRSEKTQADQYSSVQMKLMLLGIILSFGVGFGGLILTIWRMVV